MKASVKGLEGSSVSNPWVLRGSGALVLAENAKSRPQAKNNNPSAADANVDKGPPSRINQDTVRWTRAGLVAGGTASRRERETPLVREDLWLDEERPPVLATPKPHHVCRICFDVKSHPVSYACGHSHCYVCIRMRLETEWSCPQCDAVMYMAPYRHEGEEAGIKWDYPWWRDESRVSYSWEGLFFPINPRTRVLVR
ncbi:hypothetical protein C8R47DRAFT_1225741 [Mycena vitilis]|nr:hypothetical protein C8R47DRAFT_1225741 [Mycena vitilis]